MSNTELGGPRRAQPDVGEPEAAPSTTWYRRRWVQLGGALLLGLIVGAGIGIAGASDADTRRVAAEKRAAEAEEKARQLEAQVADARLQAQTAKTQAEADLAAVKQQTLQQLREQKAQLDRRASQLAAREKAVAGAEREAAANTIPGNAGTLRVGTDVKPGRYRSAGGESCYWARLSSDSGDIIDNGLGPGQQITTIKSSDRLFETNNCEDWQRIG